MVHSGPQPTTQATPHSGRAVARNSVVNLLGLAAPLLVAVLVIPAVLLVSSAPPAPLPMTNSARRLARRLVPAGLQGWLKRRLPHAEPRPVGWVDFGHLRRVTPIGRRFGLDRGRPVDRFYIERFLAEHAADVRGRVLEIGDRSYTRRYGGDRVTRSDVLHAVAGNPEATIVGDLVSGAGLASDAFDCVVLTQTIFLLYDVHAAVRTVHRILAPGGVALVTVPGISQIARNDMRQWGDFWRFTDRSARTLFEEAFPADAVEVRQWGNVLAAVAFLHGIMQEELTTAELEHVDEDYPITIAVRARKPGTAA